ncbi:hypothetical protein [Streptomyces exfoliatus]|uniref:hypothetical protein n=1 Tax=Streptomyces exfoliatus TaxID=1905 RepID=UPI003C2BF867
MRDQLAAVVHFRRLWRRALRATGLGDVHVHDLLHTGNSLAATGGATTRELMQRMGFVGAGRADLSAASERS